MKANPVRDSAFSVPSKIYWTMLAFRKYNHPSPRLRNNAALAYPKLSEFLDLHSTEATHNHLEQLISRKATAILESDDDKNCSKLQLCQWLG